MTSNVLAIGSVSGLFLVLCAIVSMWMESFSRSFISCVGSRAHLCRAERLSASPCIPIRVRVRVSVRVRVRVSVRVSVRVRARARVKVSVRVRVKVSVSVSVRVRVKDSQPHLPYPLHRGDPP